MRTEDIIERHTYENATGRRRTVQRIEPRIPGKRLCERKIHYAENFEPRKCSVSCFAAWALKDVTGRTLE